MTHEHGLDSGQQVNKAQSQILSGNHISARRHSINCGSFSSSTLFNYFGLEIIASLEDATRKGFLGDFSCMGQFFVKNPFKQNFLPRFCGPAHITWGMIIESLYGEQLLIKWLINLIH